MTERDLPCTLASPEFCSRGARARGARVPRFVVTKSSRSESHLALGLQNLRAFANSRGGGTCPMTGDAIAHVNKDFHREIFGVTCGEIKAAHGL